LVHFVVIWHIFSSFGILCREKNWQPWSILPNTIFPMLHIFVRFSHKCV
jgi:hypothetical protein